MPITFGSLFSGIGGFDLGLERAGMVCKWQVEIDPFCSKVLAKHWPHVPRFGDIHDVGKHNLEPVDVICGGFPCQPFSQAGKRRGKTDDRYLWPEMLRVIRELNGAFTDLETEGYHVEAFVLPACAVGAPHRRNRIWIIAHSSSQGYDRQTSSIQKANGTRGKFSLELHSKAHWQLEWKTIASRIYGMDNGVSKRLDRLRGLGNAVVPQIPEILGRLIVQVEALPT